MVFSRYLPQPEWWWHQKPLPYHIVNKPYARKTTHDYLVTAWLSPLPPRPPREPNGFHKVPRAKTRSSVVMTVWTITRMVVTPKTITIPHCKQAITTRLYAPLPPRPPPARAGQSTSHQHPWPIPAPSQPPPDAAVPHCQNANSPAWSLGACQHPIRTHDAHQ